MQALLYKWLFVFVCLFSTVSFISISVANVFLGLSTLIFLVLLFKNKGINFLNEGKSYLKVIAVFAGALLVSALCSGNVVQGLKTWADFFVWRLMPFFIILSIFVIKEKVNKILMSVIFGFIVTSLYVIYKGIFILEGNISYGGASGFAGHPMAYAGLSCILLPVLYVFLFKENIDNKLRLFYGIAFVIGSIASFFNATRGAWLALAIVILIESIFFISKNKKSILILGCLVAIISIGLAQNQYFMKRVSSISDIKNVSNLARIVMWDTAYEIFKKQPILGVGLGQYSTVYQNEYMKPKLEEKKDFFRNLPGFNKIDGYEQELILSSEANIWEMQSLKKLKQIDRRRIRNEYLKQSDINNYENLAFLNHIARLNHAHSNIVQMLAENGLVGFWGYIFAFVFILWKNIKNYLLNNNPYALMITASTAALALQGLTEYNFGNGAVMKIYWLVLGCLVVLVDTYNEEKLRE